MVKLVNRAKMTTATTGTGTITLGSAFDGYQSFAAAGVASGDTVRYVIEDGANWEIGTGTFNGTTLTRTVIESSNADAAISLSGQAVVFVSIGAADIVQGGDNVSRLTNDAGYLSGNQTITLSGDVSGSGTTSIVVTVADDSHNHIIANVDGLQAALDGKLSTSGKAADSNLLDGIDSSQFLRSDASDQYYRISQTPHGNPINNLGDPSVTEMALFQEQFDNKTAFYDINYLKFYTSTDGTLWTEYTSFSDDNKRKFVGGDYSSGINIPYNTPYFRIEVANAGSYVYLNALYMYWSGSGNTTTVKIRKQRGDGVWSQHTNSTAGVGSWPGHLYLPFGTIAFHPSTTSTGHYRTVHIDFQPTWSTTYTNPISLYRMQLWGGYPAGKRTHFTVDENKQTIFPSEVYANGSTSYKVFHDGYHPNADTLTTARNIALSGEVTGNANFDGSANISISTTVAADVIGANELNVTGNGTTSQYLRSDGDGSFTWATPPDTNTTYSAGSGLSLVGTVFSHADTSTQASVNNSGRTYIQDISLDTYGHVTAITSATETVVNTDTNTTYSHAAVSTTGGALLRLSGSDSTNDDVKFASGTNTTVTYTDENTITISSTDTNTTYSAGGGIGLSGTTFSVAAGGGLTQQTSGLAHADTSTQASINNSNGVVIQDVTLDGYGHVTGLASIDLDGRYYTETESNARYLRKDTNDTSVGYIAAEGFVNTGTGSLSIFNPHNANYATSSSTITGAIKITLPVSWTNTMMRMTIRIYEYATNEGFDVVCGGYNYAPSASWNQPFAYILGNPNVNRNFNVRFGHDGSKCCIYIGETTSTWSYPQVAVTQFVAGYSNYGAETWNDGWDIGFATTLGTITQTISNSEVGRYVDGGTVWHSGNDGANSGLDADTLDGQHASAFLTGNQTITLSGDLTGSGTTSINAQIAANVVGANELNVTGNGTTAQYLRSDGDGSFTWATPPDTNTTYSAGNGISLSGTTFSVAAGSGLTQEASGLAIASNGVTATHLNVTGNGTAGQVLSSDGDGSFTWIAAGGGAVTDYNVVGSWIIAYNNTTAQMYAGTAYSGSSIGYINASTAIPVSAQTDQVLAVLSGTWRCMMRVRGTTQSRSIITKYASLFVRVT